MSKIEPKKDRQFQIQAIEAKLKLMERKSEDDFEINKTVASETPVLSKYQHNKQGTSTNIVKFRGGNKKNEIHKKPYNKLKSKR